MISATRRWFRRNRSGVAIAAGIVGATYLAGQYVIGKISEARERMTSERLARENLRRRFEQNQTDCTFTVLALLPNVTENVLEALPVEQLTQELQQKKAERLARSGGEGTPSELSSGPPSIRDGGDNASLSSFQSSSYVHASQMALSESGASRPRKTKAQLWNEIKISSITRSFTLLYTLSLLTLLTRIQLNLLGRLNYLSSVISSSRPSPPDGANSISLEDNDSPGSPGGPTFGNDFETNRRYLAFTWFLLNKGYAEILSQVQSAVTEVFSTISPTEAISSTRLSELTLQVRQKFEGTSAHERRTKNWLVYLLPPRSEEEDLLIESGVLTTTPPSNSSTSASSPDRNPTSIPARTSSTSKPSPNPHPHPNSTPGLSSPPSPLRKLLDETADLIESPTFTRIHTLLLNSLFSHLIDTKVGEQAFPSPPPPQRQATQDFLPPPPPTQRITEIPSSTVTVIPDPSMQQPTTARLATILAVLTRQAHAIGHANSAAAAPPDADADGRGPGNEYVSVMEREVREVEAFAAVVYGGQLGGGDLGDGDGEKEDGGGGGGGEKREEEGEGQGEGVGLEARTLESAWSRILGASFAGGGP